MIFGDTYDGIVAAVGITRLIFAVILMFVWGFVAKSVVKSKGYPDNMNKGFWWGFFLGWIGLIVCACKKPFNNPFNQFGQFDQFGNLNPNNQYNQYGQNNQFNQYGQGGFNNYNQPNNNMYGNQGGFQQPPQYGQQPTYQQPQQPVQPTYQQPVYQQPAYQQPDYTQPDNYYAQSPQPDKQYDSGAEMDGIDTSKMDNLDDMFK